MNHAEEVLYNNLTTTDSLDFLVREGFSTEHNRECIPTELGREIVAWTLDQYHKSGRKVAPTKEGIATTWGREMERLGLAVDDEYDDDSIQWAVEELRSQYANHVVQKFVKALAVEMADAPAPDRAGLVRTYAGQLYDLSQRVTSHHQEMAADIGLDDAWIRYQERATARNHVKGLTFGLPLIDEHLMGIWPGEIAVFGAGSGVGKSWVAIKAAVADWRRGRRCMLVTLENDLEMTYDRMACVLAGISYARFQQGKLDEGSLLRFHVARRQVSDTEHGPIAVMPDEGDRDPVAIVRRAFSVGAESLIVDQLSHVEPMPGSRTYKRNEEVAQIMRGFKRLVSSGADRLSLMVMAQINREGIKNARKGGRHHMEDFAESSEVERSADHVHTAMLQPTEDNEDGVLWQKLKGRRVEPQPNAWNMAWRLGVGDIRALSEATDG